MYFEKPNTFIQILAHKIAATVLIPREVVLERPSPRGSTGLYFSPLP
jgi:hypothetical protein